MTIKEKIEHLLNCALISLASSEVNVTSTKMPREQYSRGKLILITDGENFYYVNKNTVLYDYPDFKYFS